MHVERLAIPDVLLIKPKVFGDDRGFFTETYSERAFAAAGITARFVQDNHAMSRAKGVVRGLHFQLSPDAQGKLVRVTRGAIFDVAVDLRRSSPTFGKHVTAELTAENFAELWVPEGFAHGYCTLVPSTEVLYKTTAFYAPASDRGVLWNDPALGINWPVAANDAILSDKDKSQPLFNDLPDCFA